MYFTIGKTRVYISFWFLFLAALFALRDRSFLLLPLLGAIALHEGAHLACLLLLHARIRSFSLLPYGARLDCDLSPLSPRQRAAVYLSAPLAGLLTGCIGLWLFPASIFAAFNLCLGLFNLLPLPPLDGGNALAALCGPGRGGCAARLLLAGSLGLLWGGGIFLLIAQRNPSLIILALYLSACAFYSQSLG